jgi:hypothetical protein
VTVDTTTEEWTSDSETLYLLLESYSAISIESYAIPTNTDDTSYSFSDDDGDEWELDTLGNIWYYYADGYIYFYNGTEETYYWFDSTNTIVYIEYSSGDWWGVDSTNGEQCYMSADGAYRMCWDSDNTLEEYTDDDDESPYTYYNTYGYKWFFNGVEDEIEMDSEEDKYVYYVDGDIAYVGVDGDYKYTTDSGDTYVLGTDGSESWSFEDNYDNSWGYDSLGNSWYIDSEGNYWYTASDGTEYYVAAA